MSVLSHLENTASKLVLSSSENESIKTSITTLQTRLNQYFDSDTITKHFIFGSYSRDTILPRFADDNSDIDYMIIFDNSANYNPNTFIERLKRFAENRYPTSEIYRSHPTVVLELNHIKFELVPAYKHWGFLGLDYELKIPAPTTSSNDWITTTPNTFNAKLTEKNQNNENKIRPLIRIMKFWNAQNGYIMPSYILEKDIVATRYSWNTQNLKEYFYEYVSAIDTSSLPKTKTEAIRGFQDRIVYIKKQDAQGYAQTAELELKKLIPEI